MEQLLVQLLEVAHPQDYIVMQTKITLAMMYGDLDQDSLTLTDNERQISLCEEVIRVMGKVDPGYSRRRGQLLEMMSRAKMAIMKKQEMPKLKQMLEMKSVMKLIKEACKCKQFESREEQEKFAKHIESMMVG